MFENGDSSTKRKILIEPYEKIFSKIMVREVLTQQNRKSIVIS